MQQYGVLVVDDSSFMRRSISILIEQDPQFFIIGIAKNGIDAISKIQRLKPDIVTMDVEMPEMDGIEALTEIMKNCPVPVIMLSNHTVDGAKTTIKALELGAVDFFLKSSIIGEYANPQAVKQFLASLKAIVENGRIPVRKDEQKAEESNNDKQSVTKADILVIGCSTGGPSALQSLLPRFPKNFHIPIVVIQHMPVGFTGPLAERFNTICNLAVKEAVNGDILEAGKIYIAPAGYQIFFHRKPDGSVVIKLDEHSPIETLYTPSVSVALMSAAQVFKNRLVAVIMTGMGNDGLVGCEDVKKYNGKVIVESEETCVVYGMPKVVYEAGLADKQVPLSQIYSQVLQFI